LSSIVYGAVTRKRLEGTEEGKSRTESPPGLRSYVDAMAALVPAEVLAAHATIMAIATDTRVDTDGTSTIVMTSPNSLKVAGVGLAAISIMLYWLGLQRKPEVWDWARMLIPPLAFTAWLLLQKPTAIDAFLGGINDDALRYTIALLTAVVLAALAWWLARQADKANTTSRVRASAVRPG
jgi:hypothetical protein